MNAEGQRLLNAIERYKARTPELPKEAKEALQGVSKVLDAPEARDTPGSRAAANAAPGGSVPEIKTSPDQQAAQDAA